MGYLAEDLGGNLVGHRSGHLIGDYWRWLIRRWQLSNSLAEEGWGDWNASLLWVVDESAAVVVFTKALGLEAGAELCFVTRMAVHMLELCDRVSELAVISVSIRVLMRERVGDG